MKDKLALKQRMNAKRPVFIRTDAHKKKRLAKSWRKPDGHHNKIRWHLKGYRKMVKVGYGNPSETRDMERNGMKKVLVKNIDDVQKIDPKTECAVLANAGNRKKIEIVKEAVRRKIIIFNLKNPDQFLKEAEEMVKKRQEEKKKVQTEKKEKEKVKEKIRTEKKKEEKKEEISEEEKEKMEKEEREKLLIRKQ